MPAKTIHIYISAILIALNSAAQPIDPTDRPIFHFTAPQGWLNDPNGLIFENGNWHLFYQHLPPGEKRKYWGHAVSKDLFNWQILPIALEPNAVRDQCFSGSAIIDRNNTAGFGKDAMILAYTATGQGHNLAYGTDNYQSFQDYRHNPVLKHGWIAPKPDGSIWHDSRDPKVFWDSPRNRWAMVVYEQTVGPKSDREHVRFQLYHSPNLTGWIHTQTLKGWYECPELFQLPLDGNLEDKHWILTEASGFYAIGKYDGDRFLLQEPRDYARDKPLKHFRKYILEPGKLHGPYGKAYAAQCWNDAPNNRCVMIAWARIRPPKDSKATYTQAMTIPVELSLKTTPHGPRLHYNPVTELDVISGKPTTTIGERALKAGTKLELPGNKAMRIKTTLNVGNCQDAQISINGFKIKLSDQMLGDAPIYPENGNLLLEILLDVGVIEIFTGGGRNWQVHQHFATEDSLGITIAPKTGVLGLKNLTVAPIEP